MSVGLSRGTGLNSIVCSPSWSSFHRQIDRLTLETEFDHSDGVSSLKEITRQHWKPYDSKTFCFTSSCRKQFSIILERHHHCRRCGEIFCASCLQFSRRLNKLAKPDPDGEWYKVCKNCFDQGQLSDGCTHSHTHDFNIFRKDYHRRLAADENMLGSPLWRSKLDLDRECQRLLSGFEKSISRSEVSRTLHWMKGLVAVPEWMKSSVFVREEFATSCQFCHEPFSITKQKSFCRVCGIAICKSCSSMELLIYIPDGEKEGSCIPKLAIIRIVGCPSVEPEISCHLRVCSMCKKKLEARQIEAYEESLNPTSSGQFLDQFQNESLKFQEAESRVRTQLPKYREIISSLEDNTKKNTGRNNVQALAKAQGDLADVLAMYVTVVQQLKRLKPTTNSQTLLLKTFIRAKCDFYLDNMSTFRALKSKLCESVPPESLDFIQRYMDKKAIICTHLYLRQLVYETIHLCQKHKLDEFFPSFLTKLEQVVETEVHACLHRENEDVEKHMISVKEMVKESLKEKKLINLSQSQLNRKGSIPVNDIIQQRVEAIINQVNNQLQLVSTGRSFQSSKGALEWALAELREQKTKDKEELEGFVFI